MYRLLQLIHTYRAFLFFLFLEFLSIWLIVSNNPYQSAAFFHTSNVLAGKVYETKTGVTQYFNLPEVNEKLADENAHLRELLSKNQSSVMVSSFVDTMAILPGGPEYAYLPAKVINNTTGFRRNYVTINRGSLSGVAPGMGVISADGIIGKVMAVSDHYATVSSLLNTGMYVSAILKRNNTFGSINWDGKDILTTKLLYVPRHIQIEKNDSIVTSGYNSVFPENMLIGFIDDFSIAEDASFYDIDVKLSNDFSRLSYVYIIKNPLKKEKIELESSIKQNNE